ncbi:jg7906 [Pararge aegeria aegeria]|uniref:Jg7906 protein n=1 Tax=Pararge aegeria aegeria TaxID=348720 RepID=A0A8S4R8M3_9NEOP|nr:jg7906 [Pararge aegeria aegeria]
MVYAMPSYIALPADQIAFVDLTELRARRVTRQALSEPPYEVNYHPIPLQNYQQGTVALAPPPAPKARLQAKQQIEESSPANLGAVAQIAERTPDFGEYVDFGAHTGDNGAFGWYADYPVRK